VFVGRSDFSFGKPPRSSIVQVWCVVDCRNLVEGTEPVLIAGRSSVLAVGWLASTFSVPLLLGMVQGTGEGGPNVFVFKESSSYGSEASEGQLNLARRKLIDMAEVRT